MCGVAGMGGRGTRGRVGRGGVIRIVAVIVKLGIYLSHERGEGGGEERVEGNCKSNRMMKINFVCKRSDSSLASPTKLILIPG